MTAGTVTISDWFNKETMVSIAATSTAATAWVTNTYKHANDKWIYVDGTDRFKLIFVSGA